MKIKWIMIIVAILLLLVVLAECGYQLVGVNYNIIATAEKRIKSYCASEDIDFMSFDVPHIYVEQQYDFCIEPKKLS